MSKLTPEQILAELQPIFREVLEDPRLVVDMHSNASTTPNWDSLAHIDLIEMIEQQFKVKFALGELQDLKNVGDLVTLLAQKSQ